MKKITKAEILKSQFVTLEGSMISYINPNKEYFKDCSYRELCVHTAIQGLKFRTLKDSLENANIWLEEKDDEKLRCLFI